uniref:Uncharacterized protein n=1 Tax=Globodera rostochiensis TaxID=31243 RepID=A0A914GVH8_GLORO
MSGKNEFGGRRCTDHHNFEHLNYFNLNYEHNSDHNINNQYKHHHFNHPNHDQYKHHHFNHTDHDQYKHHHFNHTDHDQYNHHHFNHCFHHHQGVVIKLYRQGWQQSVPPLQSLLQPLPDMAEGQMRKHLQLLLNRQKSNKLSALKAEI